MCLWNAGNFVQIYPVLKTQELNWYQQFLEYFPILCTREQIFMLYARRKSIQRRLSGFRLNGYSMS